MININPSCYLNKCSELWKEKYKKVLIEDSLDIHQYILDDDDISEDKKKFISNFLFPHEISMMKFMLNQDYYNGNTTVDFHNDFMHIAPSLKLLKENPSFIARGYPDWFIIAFPDVSYWAMVGDGNMIVKNKFGNMSHSEISNNGQHINDNLLQDIIIWYKENTFSHLECRYYKLLDNF